MTPLTESSTRGRSLGASCGGAEGGGGSPLKGITPKWRRRGHLRRRPKTRARARGPGPAVSAKRARVRRLVKLSVFGAETEAYSFAKIHRRVERAVEASDADYSKAATEAGVPADVVGRLLELYRF